MSTGFRLALSCLWKNFLVTGYFAQCGVAVHVLKKKIVGYALLARHLAAHRNEVSSARVQQELPGR